MNIKRLSAVGIASYLVVWLAPAPSAYFVMQSAGRHFEAPLWVSIIIAVVIEGLGLSCSHLALNFWYHNTHSQRLAKYRRAWTEFALSILMYFVYFGATLGLLVVMDVYPEARHYAKLMFPILAAVGAVNLGLREQLRKLKNPESTNAQTRTGTAQTHKRTNAQSIVQPLGGDMQGLLTLYRDNPRLKRVVAAQTLGVHRNTITNWLDQLETEGAIKRNGQGVEVL